MNEKSVRCLWPRALLACALYCACGPGVHDLSLASEPLAFVTGQVNLAQVLPLAEGKPLRAALVWAAVPSSSYVCLRYGSDGLSEHDRIRAACRDPFLFLPGQIGPSVPVRTEDGGAFKVPIDRLPGADVVVGHLGGRVAYASLIVGADADENGRLEVFNFSPNGLDTVLAASFQSLREPHDRLAYLEGALDARSFFYPARGCNVPEGFSVLSVDDVLSPTPRCVVRSLDQALTVVPLSEERARQLRCAALGEVGVRTPPSDAPDPEWTESLCVEPEVLVVFPKGVSDCPWMSVHALAGCWDREFCTEPDWDFRQDPPRWWPCH